MTLAVLLFPNENSLRSFADLLGAKYTEMNIKSLTLVCECTHVDIAIAKEEYGALHINEDENIAEQT
jgi:hypothetical protein